jgi:hypothetical protein
MHPLELYGPGDALLAKLREICLVFPEAVEAGGVGAPSFKVRDKIFAMQHRHEGRPSLWCKALPGAQEVLVGAEPERFFRPPYVGHHGWVGAWIDRDDVDWRHLAPGQGARELGSSAAWAANSSSVMARICSSVSSAPVSGSSWMAW